MLPTPKQQQTKKKPKWNRAAPDVAHCVEVIFNKMQLNQSQRNALILSSHEIWTTLHSLNNQNLSRSVNQSINSHAPLTIALQM
jgi:hypothetical protein